MRLIQARGPSAAALFIKKYNDFRYVGLGLVKPISEPSAAARTGYGAERCGHFYFTKKYRGPQKKAENVYDLC